MVAIGQLLATLDARIILSDVSASTTVDYYLLRDDEAFMWELQRADNFQQLYDWVNENY